MSLGKQLFGQHDPLEPVIREWAKNTADKLASQIRKNNLSVTEELLNSMSWKVETGQNPGIVYSFRDYGAFRDMKFLFYNKQPPVNELAEWVKRKGVNYFAYVPGYGEGGLQRPDAASRIAWGIAKNLSSGEKVNNWAKGKKQRNQWQQPTLGKAVAYLSHLLTEKIAEEAGREIIKPLLR